MTKILLNQFLPSGSTTLAYIRISLFHTPVLKFLLTLFLPANLVSSCSSTGDSGGELFTSMSDISLVRLLKKTVLLRYRGKDNDFSGFNLGIAYPLRTVVTGDGDLWRKTLK